MAYTQAQLDTLEAAIASGVLTVSYAGPPSRSVTYQSLEAMRSLRAEMRRELGLAGAAPYRLATSRNGLGGPRGGYSGSGNGGCL